MELLFKRIEPKFNDIELPMYQTTGASGMDVRAAIDGSMVIEPGKVALVPTNLMCQIPVGYELQVRPRSGLAAKNCIGVLNSPGTIDWDYRGEIKIILFNFGSEPFTLSRGDRIAQLVLGKVYRADIKEVEELNETARGEGGFGSTSIK